MWYYGLIKTLDWRQDTEALWSLQLNSAVCAILSFWGDIVIIWALDRLENGNSAWLLVVWCGGYELLTRNYKK